MDRDNHKAFEREWNHLDQKIKTWWNSDTKKSQETEILDPSINKIWYADEKHRQRESRQKEPPTLLYLPFPYVSGGGSESAFPEMYGWDTYFINRGLFEHRRYDLVRYHLLNQLFMIERYGMVLNGNRTFYLGRSQLPLHPQSIKRYYQGRKNIDILLRAYPLLKKEFNFYWTAGHHQTRTGLATNRDLRDPNVDSADRSAEIIQENHLRPELAAEAEVLDFTSIFGGDIRQCTPLLTNCALVSYAKTLKWMALEIGLKEESRMWKQRAAERSSRLNALCWDENKGFYFEYNYLKEQKLPFWSLAAYWCMWAGIADKNQAKKLVQNLERFEHRFGVAQTDKAYPSPHAEFEHLQWDYPAGWPPMHIILYDALRAYGYIEEATRIATKFVKLQLDTFHSTGKLWEKYNVVEGNVEVPRERYPVVPLHGWSSASMVYLGRRCFSLPATDLHD